MYFFFRCSSCWSCNRINDRHRARLTLTVSPPLFFSPKACCFCFTAAIHQQTLSLCATTLGVPNTLALQVVTCATSSRKSSRGCSRNVRGETAKSRWYSDYSQLIPMLTYYPAVQAPSSFLGVPALLLARHRRKCDFRRACFSACSFQGVVCPPQSVHSSAGPFVSRHVLSVFSRTVCAWDCRRIRRARRTVHRIRPRC